MSAWRPVILLAIFAMLVGALTVPPFAATELAPSASDDRVRDMMIADSLAAYPGPCACPYHIMRNGRSCGGYSAYSKPGGYAPLCYRRDISDAMVRQWRAKHAPR